MQPSRFFNTEQKERIGQAIRDAELDTSGEIRVHLERRCKGDVLDRASFVFGKLRMHKTALRNGVLFYLAVDDHQFAILGDAGINTVTPDDFWDNIRDRVMEEFAGGRFVTGLETGIRMAGEKLKEHFPYREGDINELPDEISFSDQQDGHE